MPLLASAFLLAGLASLGLPGTSGFVSELVVFLGTFKAWPWPTALGVFGIVLTAGYILWMVQRSFFGPAVQRFAGVKDVSVLEMLPAAVLVLAILVVGVYPAIVADVFTSGIEPLVPHLERAAQTAQALVR